MAERDVFAREIAHHEKLYSGFAQSHFAKPAVRAFREHLARRILEATAAGPGSRLLSLGCGIGDTELLLARRVGRVVGLDLSPAAVRQARADAAKAGVSNAEFREGTLEEAALEPASFDAVIAVFFLHHLPDGVLDRVPEQVNRLLKPGGTFYSLDPSRRRLSGAVGRLVAPKLMAKYQSPDERELDAAETARLFERAGFAASFRFYDFVSTPMAGLFPGARRWYRLWRAADEILVRTPGVRGFGSNFEVIARKPAKA